MKEKLTKQEPKKYSKEKILDSNKFTSIQKHLLDSLLEKDRKYSITEVTKLIEEILKKEVK